MPTNLMPKTLLVRLQGFGLCMPSPNTNGAEWQPNVVIPAVAVVLHHKPKTLNP